MKILFLIEYPPIQEGEIFTGGVESRVYHIAHYLKEHGHSVDIESRTTSYAFNSLQTLLSRFIYMLKHCFSLDSDGKKYDIVEGTNFVTYLPAFFRARKFGAKAIAWYPDVFIGHGIKRLGLVSGLVVELIERIVLKLPWDGIIALSEETKKRLIMRGVGEEKISVVHGGVCIGTVQQQKKYSSPTLLCIARLVAYKRVHDAILAMYLLKEKISAIRLIIVGTGPEKRALKRLMFQLGLKDMIEWRKRIGEEEKWDLLRRSHLHILPSVVEGFGLVTVEALSAGTPVVNADISINREVLRGSTGGLLYCPGDYVALACCIEKLLGDRKLYNQKTLEGKKLVKQYDWNVINKQTEGVYQYLLSH